jgi:SEC-C motif domain protein
MSCSCGLNQSLDVCCGPIISGAIQASTAEQIMRARYTAYTQGQIDFIKKTLAPESQKEFSVGEAKKWAADSEWLGLKVLGFDKGQATDRTGTVEFVAKYKDKTGEEIEHHEVAKFRKNEKGEWLFVDGDSHVHRGGEGHHHHHHKPQTIVRETPKVGRNEPCPCGSEKKYKKCCGATVI